MCAETWLAWCCRATPTECCGDTRMLKNIGCSRLHLGIQGGTFADKDNPVCISITESTDASRARVVVQLWRTPVAILVALGRADASHLCTQRPAHVSIRPAAQAQAAEATDPGLTAVCMPVRTARALLCFMVSAQRGARLVHKSTTQSSLRLCPDRTAVARMLIHSTDKGLLQALLASAGVYVCM